MRHSAPVQPRVTPVAAPLVQRECATCGGPSTESVCTECEAQEAEGQSSDTLQTARGGWGAPRSVAEALRGPGRALDGATRSDMEHRFGRDLSQVRVHTGGAAARSAADLLANAYTVGRDIVFAEGRYAPNTTAGRHLLAHELTHVVQQGGRAVEPMASLEVGPANDPAEVEAERVADAVVQTGDRADIVHQVAPRIARQGPGGAAPPVAPVVPCVRPINWVHGPNAADNGPDGIRIPISWQSSTGNLADLSNCEVREVVDYDPIPNPPFLWTPPNPTILTVPGTAGAGADTHSYPPGLKTGITDPRTAGTMTAHQVYQWRCTGPGCTGTWTDWPGETYTMTREVWGQFVRPNPWRYKITKTGGAAFSYSREVEIPEP